MVWLQVGLSGCRCAGRDDTHWLGSGVRSRGFSGPSFFSAHTFPHTGLLPYLGLAKMPLREAKEFDAALVRTVKKWCAAKKCVPVLFADERLARWYIDPVKERRHRPAPGRTPETDPLLAHFAGSAHPCIRLSCVIRR